MVGSFRVIQLPGKCRHYGLRFALNEHWAKPLVTYESIDDRIAVATFKLSERAFMKVVNVYAPTQAKSNADASIRDRFYDQLESLLNKIGKHVTLFISGDFNAKIGQDGAATNCSGRHCRGRRNRNGQQLVEFCEAYDLLATNTCFAHHACHLTTWQGQRRDAQTGKAVPIFNQIDYIFMPSKHRNLVLNARSY